MEKNHSFVKFVWIVLLVYCALLQWMDAITVPESEVLISLLPANVVDIELLIFLMRNCHHYYWDIYQPLSWRCRTLILRWKYSRAEQDTGTHTAQHTSVESDAPEKKCRPMN